MALAGLLVACTAQHGPHLESVEPAAAHPGAMVRLTGDRLCGEDAACDTAGGSIQIGVAPKSVVLAQIVAYTDREATIVVPAVTPAGATVLVATVNDLASNDLPFDVLSQEVP